jgi:inosose dehydratase
LVTLGTAPDSWGVWFPDDPRQPPWQRFLDEVVEVGYRWIELGPSGYLPTSPERLESELATRGLRVASGGVMFALEDPVAFEDTRPQLLDVCSLLAQLRAQHLLLIDDLYIHPLTGDQIAPAILGDSAWTQLIATADEVAAIAREYGLATVFHPHAETHVQTEEEIERFLAEVSPEVGICLDVGHHAYAGGEPIAFLERHERRIPYLHLKNIDAVFIDTVRRERLTFSRAVAEGVFVEPQNGLISFEALRDSLARTGYDGFAIVEQDMYPTTPDTPLPIARRTLDYLLQIGFGDVEGSPSAAATKMIETVDPSSGKRSN